MRNTYEVETGGYQIRLLTFSSGDIREYKIKGKDQSFSLVYLTVTYITYFY